MIPIFLSYCTVKILGVSDAVLEKKIVDESKGEVRLTSGFGEDASE
jgi:hypothetical protein